MQNGDKVYLVKYALSNGIEPLTVEESSVAVDGLVSLEGRKYTYYRTGSEVFSDKEEAIASANAMRDKKIISLKKQIAKLELLDFAAELAEREKGGANRDT